MESVIHNMYYTISHVPPPEKSDDTSNFQMWSVSGESYKFIFHYENLVLILLRPIFMNVIHYLALLFL
jgi:hypothetical protein